MVPVAEGSLVTEGVRERQDLQQWIRQNPAALGEELLILGEEFCDWEDSKRRIDLLALDADANLVVIELKRTDDGGHMDLQAVRYAAMISAITFDDIVRVHEAYLAKCSPEHAGSARERVLRFLDATDGTVALSSVPRILLVSRDFSREITTTVLWLIERGVDIRCVQVVAYKLADRLLLDLRQVIPLPQASDYQVRLRHKDEMARQAATSGRRELTLRILATHDIVREGTEIEVVPEARPADGANNDQKVFRARIGDLTVRRSVIWAADGETYSPTELTEKLFAEHGVSRLRRNIFWHWRIVGHDRSMWDESEALARPE